MKPHFLALPLALTLAAGACTTAPALQEVKQLQWVVRADPIADAKNALASGQHTLLAVWGVTWLIPGVNDKDKVQYRERYGVRFIEGTGDVLYSQEHAQLVEQAYSYAAAYNRHVLSQLHNE